MAVLSTLVSGLVLALANSQAVVANEVIRAGEVITLDMVSSENGTMALDSPVIGRETRRTVYGGQPISMENTRSPRLVTRNDVVTIKYIKGGLEITTTGRAMEEGGLNDTVSVLNLSSRKLVSGTVQKEGWVLAQ